MKLIYISHPFGGIQENLSDAEFLVSELSKVFDAQFWAPWIPLCRYWPNEKSSLERGLIFDDNAVTISAEAWFFASKLSSGMAREMKVALANKCHIERFDSLAQGLKLVENTDCARARAIRVRLGMISL